MVKDAPPEKAPEPPHAAAKGKVLTVFPRPFYYDTYSEEVKELAALLVNEARLVQSSVSGFRGVPKLHLSAQIQAVHETVHTIARRLEISLTE